MRKIFIVAGILLSILAIFFSVVIFIASNPDRLKPLIVQQFQKYTPYTMTIDDHLSFSYFPYFGVKAKEIELSIAGQNNQVEIKNAVVQLKLLPFLHGKIETGSLQIAALTLKQNNFDLTLNQINLNIATQYPSPHTFLMALSFNVSAADLSRPLDVKIASEIVIDTTHQIAYMKNIKANLSDLTLQGELQAQDFLDNPTLSGRFIVTAAHLKNFLEQVFPAIQTDNIPEINTVIANLNLLPTRNSLNIRSDLHINAINIKNIAVSDIDANLDFENNLLTIDLSHADVVGGSINGNATLNLTTSLPFLTAHLKLLNLQIDPLFKLIQTANINIYPDTTLSGTGNLEINLSTNGNNLNSLLNNLNGTGQLGINEGFLAGKDLDDIVIELAASQPAITSESITQNLRVLKFKQLSGTFNMNHGIISEDDLQINAADITIHGRGQINLPNNFFDFSLQVDYQNTLADNHDNNPIKEISATIPLHGALTLQ